MQKGLEKMEKNPLELQHLNSLDFKKKNIQKVILPLGSFESHGYHLPFGTDALTAHSLALDIAARVPDTGVLPPLNYGVSEHYKNFSFTISISFESECAFLRDIFESLYREGIRKVFVMNGHDGNIAPIEIAARGAKVAHPEFRIACLNAWWYTLGDILPEGFFEVWNGLGHAGEGETSMCLELFPQLVELSQAKGVVPARLPAHLEMKWTFDELTNTGASGDPTKASPEKGRKMRAALVDAIVQELLALDAEDWDYRSAEVK
jgi:creatinine amidohydrolase